MKFQAALSALVLARASAELVINTDVTAEALVEFLLDNNPEITYSNAQLTGDAKCSAIFSGATQSVTGLDIASGSGLILSTGDATLLANADSDKTSTSFRQPGDADLQGLAGTRTGDACILEFEFVCEAEPCELRFKYAFGSEEYSLTKSFDDVFGWFLDGTNIAVLPNEDGSNKPPEQVSIKNVNKNKNAAFYVDNDPSGTMPYPGWEPNGMTVVLEAVAVPTTGDTHTMKLAITDVADLGLDSWVILEEGFLATTPCELGCGKPQQTHKVEVCHNANKQQVTICIARAALETHLQRHGDFCGRCPGDTKSVGDDDEPEAGSGAMDRGAMLVSALVATIAMVFAA